MVSSLRNIFCKIASSLVSLSYSISLHCLQKSDNQEVFANGTNLIMAWQTCCVNRFYVYLWWRGELKLDKNRFCSIVISSNLNGVYPDVISVLIWTSSYWTKCHVGWNFFSQLAASEEMFPLWCIWICQKCLIVGYIILCMILHLNLSLSMQSLRREL